MHIYIYIYIYIFSRYVQMWHPPPPQRSYGNCAVYCKYLLFRVSAFAEVILLGLPSYSVQGLHCRYVVPYIHIYSGLVADFRITEFRRLPGCLEDSVYCSISIYIYIHLSLSLMKLY